MSDKRPGEQLSVAPCACGRIHLQVGMVTLSLTEPQLAELWTALGEVLAGRGKRSVFAIQRGSA